MDNFEDIIGYEGFYQINRLGQIKNIAQGHRRVVGQIKKISSNGVYPCVLLSKDKKNKMHRIHRLLGIQFIPNPENKTQIDHIDKNQLNNELSNLRWVTATENSNNRSTNVTPEQYRLNRLNSYKKQYYWKSIKSEFLHILL